jgi:hypothetical protein
MLPIDIHIITNHGLGITQHQHPIKGVMHQAHSGVSTMNYSISASSGLPKYMHRLILIL